MNMLICDCNIWLKLQASGFWKHLAFAIIMDEIELPPDDATLDHHLGDNLQMHHTLSESRPPFANAFPTPMEHHVSNEA